MVIGQILFPWFMIDHLNYKIINNPFYFLKSRMDYSNYGGGEEGRS